MPLYDEDDGVSAQIVSIDTASSRGQKHEEIRATCVELVDGNVPDCAITLTGKVKTKCNVCWCNHEIDYGISSTDPKVKYQPIEELISAYEKLG